MCHIPDDQQIRYAIFRLTGLNCVTRSNIRAHRGDIVTVIVFMGGIGAIDPNRTKTHSKVECYMGSQLLTPVDKLRPRVQVVAISATNCPNNLNLPI